MNNVFNRKSAFTKLLSAWAALSVVVTTSAPAFAAGTAVLGGNSVLADLTRVTMDSNTPDAAVFSSTAASGVLDWTKFNIGAGQSMTFDGASTTFFNLVDGAAGKSQIDGIINGNGNVWVINPAGVAFGAGSKVDLGGLFAAAAGNVENAIALRDGTATLPTFSSFDGNVTTTGGFGVPSSQFSASQVALLGRKVSAAGDFAGADKLTLGASDKLVVVDDVYGGSVSIGLSDLVASDAEVSLGDLDVGGSLSVVAGNDVGVVGAVAVDGDVTITVAKDLDIDVNGALSADGNVFVYSATSPTMGMPAPGTAGKTSVDGTVEAGGDVLISVAGGIDIGGSVASASGSVLASSGSSSVGMSVAGSANAVKVSGSVTAAAGTVNISAWEGSVDIAGGHVSGSGGVNLTAIKDVHVGGDVESDGMVRLETGWATMAPADLGAISVDGTVTADGDVSFIVAGSLNIGADGGVYSTAGNVMATTTGPISAEDTGSVSVDGTVAAANGNVVVDMGLSGKSVDIGGTVDAGGIVQVSTGSSLSVDGTVKADNNVIFSVGKDLGIGVDGFVSAGDDVVVSSPVTTPETSVVSVDGRVEAGGDAVINMDMFDRDIAIGGSISAVGRATVLTDGAISVDGAMLSGEDVLIMANGGLDIGGSVASVIGNVMASAGSSSGFADAGKDVKISGSLSAAENVKVSAWEGSVDIAGGHIAGSGGVNLTAAKDVAVGGSVRSEGDVYVAAAMSTAGGLSVDGDVEAGGAVRLVAASDAAPSGAGVYNVGRVNVVNGSVVSRGGEINISGTDDVTVGASAELVSDKVGVGSMFGDVAIDGVVKADVATFVAGKSVSAENRDNEIGLLYSETDGDVAIVTKNDVAVGGIYTCAGGTSVSVKSVEGSIDVSHEVAVEATDGVIVLDGKYGVTSSGKLSVEHGKLEVYGNKGDIDLYNSADGVVLAGKIILVAEGNVYADNPNNVIGEVVKAQAGVGKELRIDVGTGEAVTIGDIYADTAYVRSERGTIKVVGDVSAPDMVYLETEKGDVIVMEGCTVEARGDGAVVVLKAGRDIVNDGTLKSDGAVDLAAGRDIAGKGTVAAAGDVAATAGRSAGLKAENGISLGDVTAEGGDVSVSTVRGDIVVNGTVQSKADDGVVLLAAATDESEDGGIVVNDGGNLVAPGAEGTVIGIAGYGKLKAEGSLDDKQVLGLLKSARMLMGTSPAPESSVRIIEGANVAAGKRIVLEGRISVISAGTINAANAKLDVVAKEGSIDLYADGTGIVIAGGVSAEAGDAILIDNPGNAIGQLDRVKVGTGEVDINLGGAAGKVGVVGAADLTGGMAVGVGTMLLVGDIEQGGLVYVVSVDGDVVVAENCKIKATGDGAIAFLNAARDIRISGQVESDGMVQMVAGRDLVQEGTVAAGVVDVVATRDVELGDVQASSAVWIYDLDGDGIPDPQSIGASTVNGQIRVRDGASLQATDADGAIYLTADNGVVVGENSSIRANGARGAIYVSSLGGSAPAGVKGGALDLNGTLSATKEVLVINVNGDVNVGASGRISSDNTSFVEAKQGNMVVDGRVDSADAAFVSAIRGTGPQDVSVVVNGTVAGNNEVMVDTDRGDIVVNGSVQSSGADGFAVVAADKSGDISFGALGSARGTSSVYVKAGGGNLVHQSGASVAAINGYADSVSLPAAVEGKDIVLQVNGSVGSTAQSVAVDGNVVGLVSGDAYIAAAGAKDLKGGSKSFDQLLLPSFSGNVVTIDLTQLNADNAMFVGGSLSAYSAGQVQKGNVLEAGRDLTITAGTFGDVSYLQAGGTLSINNVGRPSSPQVAYFESVNGVEPRINNQPNGVAIFIDGRLVGGNLQVINEFGSDEAFMVDTPELKSTQGIFGSPTFMHSDLDVANPMEVGVIDYMIQEVPRLTLSSDFPADADQSVEASGLSQRDVYWFGQKTTAAGN